MVKNRSILKTWRFDEREAALADRKAQRKQAAAEKAAAEAAEAKESAASRLGISHDLC